MIVRLIALLAATLVIGPHFLTAQTKRSDQRQNGSAAKARKSNPKPRRKKESLAFTPEREAAAVEFAKMHHPELAALLVKLAKNDTESYEAAVLQIFHASETLTATRMRDEERYEVDLDYWRADSRIRLLAARLRKQPRSERLVKQIRPLLVQRIELRIKQQELSKRRLESKLKQIDQTIERLKKSQKSEVNKTITQMTRQNSRNKNGVASKRSKASTKDRLTKQEKDAPNQED